MRVTTKISVDLTRQNTRARVDAIQWDENTRCVDITLLSGGSPWEPPTDADAHVAYIKPDRTKGMYNLLPDGSQAIDVNGSTVTVTLVRQMLAVPGIVNASIVFCDADLNQLTTFPFTVHVQPSVYAGQEPSQDYIRLQWLEDKLGAYLAIAEESVGAAAEQARRDRLAAESAAGESKSAAAEAKRSEGAAASSASASAKFASASEESAKTAGTKSESAGKSAEAAQEAERKAADDAKASEVSATEAAQSAGAARESERKAAMSQAAAKNALQGMVYVTFATDENGHVLIRNGDLLGTTAFILNAKGHLEVDY